MGFRANKQGWDGGGGRLISIKTFRNQPTKPISRSTKICFMFLGTKTTRFSEGNKHMEHRRRCIETFLNASKYRPVLKEHIVKEG